MEFSTVSNIHEYLFHFKGNINLYISSTQQFITLAITYILSYVIDIPLCNDIRATYRINFHTLVSVNVAGHFLSTRKYMMGT